MEDCRVRLVIQEILSLLVVYLVLALPLPADTDTSEAFHSPNTIVVLSGDNAILPCSLINQTILPHLVVEWSRSDLKDTIVHINREGRDIEDQNPYYMGRTSMFLEQLKNGNVSLKLNHVKVSDSGEYSCDVPSQASGHQAVIKLVVDGSFPKSYGGLIAGIIILVVAVAVAVGFFIWRKKTRVVESDKHVGELVQITEHKEETEKQLKHQLEETETLLEQEKEKQKKLKAEQEELLKQKLEDQEKQQLEDQEKQQLEEQEKLHKQELEEKYAVQFVAKHKDHFIYKTSNHDAKVIAGELLKNGLISLEENININKYKRWRMDGLYKVLESGGPEVKAGLYRSLMEHHPDLLKELETIDQPDSGSEEKQRWWITSYFYPEESS